MNQRENLLSLLKRKGFESIPVEFNLCPHLSEVYREREKTELSYADFFEFPWESVVQPIAVNPSLERFFKYHKPEDLADPTFSLDCHGVGHKTTPTSMHMSKMIHPLFNADSVSQIEEYPLEQFDDEKSLTEIKKAVAKTHEKGLAAVGNMQCTVWETSWYLRGMENLMMDMMSEEKIAAALLDKVTAMSKSRADLFTRAGVDILFLGDDIGMQKSIMMSKELYNEWIKPRLAEIIAHARKANPNILVFYHSCGYVEPFIDTLIEVGVDVLNPVQPECMRFDEIHEKYGERISFHGTIGTQTTLPFGTPQEVRNEVEKNLKLAGAKGGLFAAPTHLLEPEVPWENIKAYVDVCKGFCK